MMGPVNNPCKTTYSNIRYMKEPCICEVCTCGHHQCPHQLKQQLPWGPCVISEYSAKYQPHCFEPRKPIIPETMVQCSKDPLSHQTTTRSDYKPQPLCPPQRREKEGYRPPSTALDCLTNYRLEFRPKQICPPEPCLPPPIISCPAKFDGNPTYRSDYRQWNLPPLVRHKELPHKPPEAPFEGLPIYRTDYTPKCDARRANFKPKSELILPDSSIDEVTNYRADYVPHPLQPRLAKGKTLPFKSCTPFNSMTTVQSDYTPKDFCIPQSFKPSDNLSGSKDPMSQSTTHRADYIPHPLCAPYKRLRDEYKEPQGSMETDTTYRTCFPILPLCKSEVIPQLECPKCPAPFDGTTMYKAEFKHWNIHNQVVKTVQPYRPPSVPMETVSTSQADFGPKLACKIQISKPITEPLCSGPFYDQTNYRTEYTPKHIDCRCPAAYLSKNKVSPDGYAFEAIDPCGHEHYKLVENSIKS